MEYKIPIYIQPRPLPGALYIPEVDKTQVHDDNYNHWNTDQRVQYITIMLQ